MYNINNDEIQEFCSDLSLYLMDRYNYETHPAYPARGWNIEASGNSFNIYLRFKPIDILWPSDSIVISNIQFDKKRIGNGDSLLRFFIDQSEKYGFKHVGIEQTHSEAGKGFAKKYGFQSIDNQKNWSISIEHLSKNLSRLSDQISS